jgi:hypothetical protein
MHDKIIIMIIIINLRKKKYIYLKKKKINNNNILVFRWPRTSNVDVRYTSKLKNSTATYLIIIIITMGENFLNVSCRWNWD